MNGQRFKIAPNTWKKLMVLGEKQGSIKLCDMAQELGLGEEETLIFIRQLFPQGNGFQVYQDNSECWVDISAESLQYALPLTPFEWMELHEMLASVPGHTALKRKLSDNGPVRAVMDLLNQLELWDQQLTAEQQTMVKDLDVAIAEKHALHISTHEGKNFGMFPCKVLHLEGQLSLVAEDAQDHCLTVMSMKEISEISSYPVGTTSKVSAFEVEEFIAAIRAMNERETRLILKIHEPQSVNLFPDHHFLGKPCMITNPNGDLIWAAYVEPCEALFDWLYGLGKKVEILDPSKFKHEYLAYCEEKARKIA